MKRKHVHTRTVSRLPPDAFIEEFINDRKDEEEKIDHNTSVHTNKKTKRSKDDIAHVIILGAENTGKTTLFNQLRYFCGSHGISDSEMDECKVLCIKHLMKCASNLCRNCISLNLLKEQNNTQIIMTYATYSDTFINQMNVSNQLSKIKQQLKKIFHDKCIIKTFSVSHYDLVMNSEYFLKRLYKYFDEKYQCHFEDYLMLYHDSALPIDEIIEFQKPHKWNITVTDVCGQRALRPSWTSILNIRYTACLFVVSLSDYNVFYRNGDKQIFYNKLIEQFELLSNMMKIPQFVNNISNIIVILNKKDVFEKQLKKHNISFYKHFPLFLCKQFHFENRGNQSKENMYCEQNSDLDVIKKKNRMQFEFDKAKEFDSEYIIEYIKRQITKILPDALQQKMRIYITSIIAPTFKYVVDTLCMEIVHMEQLYKSSMN